MKTKLIIKKTLLALLCSSVTTGVVADNADIWKDFIPNGQSLESVESVINALDNGAPVNATVDMSKCTPEDDGAPSTIRGGLKLSTYRINEDGTLWFEDSFISVSSGTGREDPVMVLLRYLANPEGSVTVTSFVFSIPDYTLTMKESFDCSINIAIDFNTTY
jgi:hypothetical protein